MTCISIGRRMAWAGLAFLVGAAVSCGDDATPGVGESGDPSEDTLSVALSAAAADETVLLNPRGTWWVWDKGGDLGTAWRAQDYVETGWKSAAAPLGYGESYVTPISYGPDPNNKYITTYFRKKFFVEDAGAVQSLRLEVMFDDGFVFYVNGQEGGRARMPSGPVTASTLALGHEAGNAYESFDASAVRGALQTGWNMLAVEVHQQAPSSSDLVFDASLIARLNTGGPPPPPEEGGFDTNSSWLYWDRGGDLGTAWRAAPYDDSGWRTGGGPLGYGESYLMTTVSFGPSSSNKFITSYFRKKFILNDPSSVREMRIAVMYDDGFVVYVNGQELHRASMPAGAINASTRAFDHEAGNRYETFVLDDKIGFLAPGENIVAVEVHQSSPSSSDLVFDLGLILEQGPPPPQAREGIGSGSVWFYHDEGPIAEGWKDTAGAGPLSGSGPGPLGYGEPYIRTPVSFGSSASNKHITTYFRHEFTVLDVASILAIYGSVMYDDGAIVYLNGQEIQRLAMPAGAVGFSTRALDHEARNLYEEFDWSPARSLLREGRNYLAVEVHQSDPASSDLVFDLALTFGRSNSPAWIQQSAGVTNRLSDLSFVDSNFGWIVGGEGTILHTRSGGNSWSRQISGTNASLNGVSFADRAHGWVVGSGHNGIDGGGLWSTSDGGARWKRDPNIPGSYYLLGVHFISASRGWAVGRDHASGTAIVLSTTDGGISWNVRTLSGGLRSVVFADENHGWIAGLEGVPDLLDEHRAILFHTSDGGATWVSQNPGTQSHALWSVTAVSATRAWAAGTTFKPEHGDGWSAIRTTDGGATWTSSSGPVDRELFGISFGDAMNGWVAGAYGTIAATQDGGATWATQVDDAPQWYLNVEFVDATTGWVIGENGIILRTWTGGR